MKPISDYEYVEGTNKLETLLAGAEGVKVYAIDTEFHRERSYHPKLGLLQLAWPGRLLLVDPLKTSLNPLRSLLESSATALMHAGKQDLEILARTPGVIPRKLFDTQTAARFCGMNSPSLNKTLRKFLKVNPQKGNRMTNWLTRPLTPRQLDYAASDVRHLIPLWEALRAELESRGRLEWAEEECEQIRLNQKPRLDPGEAWRKVKEVRDLQGRALSRSAVIADWRERRAEHLNIPPRFVLSDLGVAVLAQNPLKTKKELKKVRGVNAASMSESIITDLLDLLKQIHGGAAALPEVSLPPCRPQPGPAAKLAAAWLSQAAADLKLDSSLAASRKDIEDFLSGDPNASLAHGWRYELFGAHILRIGSGEAAVALNPAGKLVLEERSGRPL